MSEKTKKPSDDKFARGMRTATVADLPLLVDMGAAFHEAASLPFDYDPESSAAAMTGMIEGGGVFVTERGAIGGVLGTAWSNPAWVYACELFWWAEDGQGRALLRRFEEWARESGAGEVRMTSLYHLDRAGKILERLGYTAREISYGKNL